MEFRLIVRNPLFSKNTTSILLDNQHWYLSEPLRFGVGSIPNFAAISYRWGLGRAPNPFYDGQQMSDQTYYALSAAIKNSHCEAFWIDALCIPIVQPARSNTLGAMGFIYSIADEVIVSFPLSKSAALKELQTSDRFTDEALKALEDDEWVKSVWTYDEVVNSKSLQFVSGDNVVEGENFLNAIGYSLSLYKKANNLTSFDVYQNFPHIDALESLTGDWLQSFFSSPTFENRSAFQVMSNLDRRSCTDPQYYFYALIASITDEIIPVEQATEVSVESLAETAMDICEGKNDFSFVFSTARRDERVGKEWRPMAGVFHSVLAWPSSGISQNGYWENDDFYLSAIISLKPSAVLGELGETCLDKFLRTSLPKSARGDFISRSIFSLLVQLGFSGHSEGIPTSHGFFYPQTMVDVDEELNIFVSTQICWTFGAPALAKFSRLGKVRYVPGVFIGLVDKQLASDVKIARNSAI